MADVADRRDELLTATGPRLDGQNDRHALLHVLLDLFRNNVIRIDYHGQQILDEQANLKLLGNQMDTLPQRLADLKLLDLGAYPPSQ